MEYPTVILVSYLVLIALLLSFSVWQARKNRAILKGAIFIPQEEVEPPEEVSEDKEDLEVQAVISEAVDPPTLKMNWELHYMTDESLDYRQVQLLDNLRFIMVGDDIECSPTQSYLADQIGVSPRTVSRLVKDLVSLGYLTTESKPGTTTVYRATLPKSV